MCEIYDVPGLSVAIIDDDNEYYISVGETIDEHSRFELASTTKAFTALGILKLEKEGKLFVIRPPESLGISRTERRPEELERVYQIGRSEAKKQLEAMKKYLEIE